MKQKLRNAWIASRVLFSVMTALIVVCMALTVSAANVLGETTMTYDFTTYTSSNNAISDGWSTEGEVPSGATRKGVIVSSGGFVGVGDYVTREGFGLYENLVLVYNIPENDRICLSEYDKISFTRKLANDTDFLVSGAKYSVILTLDTGDSVTVTLPWYTSDVDTAEAVIEKDLQTEFESLPTTAKLVKISFVPYVNTDDFRPETAVENNLLVQFLVGNFVFKKAVDMPVLEAVEDTYDGLQNLKHNGAITGLNPDYRYEYKLTYASEWTSVNDVSRIDGLTGAAYLVRRVADADSGLEHSEPVVVNVPKTVNNGLSYTKNEVSYGKLVSKKSMYPVIGTWTYGNNNIYDASGSLTAYVDLANLTGVATGVDYPQIEGAYYRRNVYKFEYALTADEQIDISKSSITFNTRYAGTNFPYSSYQEVSGIMFIYVSGNDEPYRLTNIRHNGSEKNYVFNLSRTFPDAEGYIERIVYYPLYDQLTPACNSNSYMQISNLVISQIPKAVKPGLFVVDLEDGSFKICGLKMVAQYEISYDKGETWELLPKGITSIDNCGVGTYYIRQAGDKTYFPSDPAVIVINARRDAPEGLSLSGTSIVGLDPEKQYEYAPYSFAGDMIFTKVESGATSIDSLTSGMWAVRYPEEEGYLAGDIAAIFIDGSSTKGKVTPVSQDKLSTDRGFATGEFRSDLRAVSQYGTTDPRSLVMYEGWGRTTDMSVNETLNLNYTFTSEQVFDIKQLHQFTYKAGFQGCGLYLNGGSLTGFQNKIRFYVVGSDVEYYDVYSPWTYAYDKGKMTFNVADALPADAHGYVVAYSFFYYGKWPEITSILSSGVPYPRFYVYDLTLRSKVAAPKPVAQYNASGTFTISGLSASNSHGYSSDGKTFIELPSGTTSFEVKSPGTYYVYAENYYGQKSELAVVEARIDSSAAVTGLKVLGNTITGFTPNLHYEYRKYSLSGSGEYTKLAQGATTLDNLSAGLWEIRYVTPTNNSKSSYYLVYGENNGTIAFNALYKKGGDVWGGEKDFVSGRWTSSKDECYLNSTTAVTSVRLATIWKSSLEKEELESFYYSYQFTDDEIISATDIKPITYYFGFAGGNPYSKPALSRVRYYVVGSDVEYYDTLATPTKMGAATVSNLLSTHPDANGYVVAIRVWPCIEFPSDTTLQDNTNRYPVLRFNVQATGETDPRLMARINLGQIIPQGLSAERTDANLYQNYKITGLLENKAYEYSCDGENWIQVEAGATEISSIPGGRYYVRFAATANDEASEAVEVITPSMTPAFITREYSNYPYAVSQEFTEGLWTNYPAGWDQTNEPVSYIGSNVALNTVKYAYTFLPEHRFTVNEYPIFTLDFNNSLVNMTNSTGIISGALAEVDIYFVGSEEPYTVSGEWKGNDVGADGYTPNRILVDLLGLDAEMGEKTVRAMVIRPYSNITSAPSSYGENAYINFKLFNIGFYSTMDNVAAITSDTHKQVNEFVAISLENVPKTATVGDSIGDRIVIKANYSDGTYDIIAHENAQLDIPVLDNPGVYTVSVSYRGTSAEAEIIVDIDVESIEIYTLPTKTVYYVGEMLELDGISFKYVTADGETVISSDNYEAEIQLFETAGAYTIPVKYCGTILNVNVTVLPEGSGLVIGESSAWSFNANTKKLYINAENVTVADVIAAFAQTSAQIALYNRVGEDITADTEALVGTGFMVATIVDGQRADFANVILSGDVNGNGRIDTNDYILIKRAYLNTVVISEGSDTFTAADVNGNGVIDTNDYLKIKNHYRGVLNLFN
jgi:hypothetical protein